mmetsp:Transcript_20088/g.30425  ORF Transcript_20088/g.30425 Transcript_20088/m.30425 type:complete len:133 (+) Transcript_20088:199-597(+)
MLEVSIVYERSQNHPTICQMMDTSLKKDGEDYFSTIQIKSFNLLNHWYPTGTNIDPSILFINPPMWIYVFTLLKIAVKALKTRQHEGMIIILFDNPRSPIPRTRQPPINATATIITTPIKSMLEIIGQNCHF